VLLKRVIPCLDVADGRVVKGTRFVDLRDEGDPAELAARYAAEGADEIVFLDITAAPQGRATLLETVERTARQSFVPLTVGGGVRSPMEMRAVLRAGADKVAINTAAIEDPTLISRCARVFGAQCVVVAIDARRVSGSADGSSEASPAWEVVARGGRQGTGLDALEWAARGQEFGVGEILLNSMDADGTRAGYDVEMTAAVRRVVDVPVVASGGAGRLSDFAAAVAAGADAVLAASVFHFGLLRISEVKAALAAAGHTVR